MFANALADLAQLAVLAGEAAWELARLGSGRKALVAAWFAFGLQPASERAARLGGPARCPLLAEELFRPVVRQELVPPEAVLPSIVFLLPQKASL